MVNVDKSVIAKLKKGSKTYEVLVDPERAIEFRKGKSVSINDVLITDEIFYDAKKGTRASEHELEKIFGTDNKEEICKIIIKEGIVPLTADMLRKDLDNKRKQIVNFIHKNVIDPTSGKPHPPQRIDAAMTEAKVRIDDNKTAEQQVRDVIEKLRPILPIKFEIRELSLRIPPEYAGRSIPIIKKFGRVIEENWDSDGSLKSTIEIPAGVQEELEIALNNITKGSLEVRIINKR